MPIKAAIVGVGSCLPERVVTNHDLAQTMDTSDAWIRERTGIIQRHIAGAGETTASLATEAARRAMAQAGILPDEVDMVLVATSTPDLTMPSTATLVQQRLGIRQGFGYDLAAACSGFVYGLATVKSAIESGMARCALLIGAETMSRIVDWDDRTTSILFGDGAGAVVVKRHEGAGGVLAAKLYSDGAYSEILATSGGVSVNKQAGVLGMAGQEVFRHGVEKMASVTVELIAQAGLSPDAIDWFVPHQANARIIQSIARKLSVAPERFIVTLDLHANTSAASIPLALDVACRDGRIKAGQKIAMPALGAGLTWGGCIIEWI